MVTAYNPCYSPNPLSGSTYKQHRRYFIQVHKDTTCPQTRFQHDLVYQLKKLRSNSENLILCMDVNQHVYTGAIGQDFTNPAGLVLQEPIEAITGQKIGPTFFRGSKPIDAVWTSPSLNITNACVLPVGIGVSNHHMFVLDITTHSIVGVDKPPIQRPPHCCLSTRSPKSVQKYNSHLTDLLTQH